MEEEMLAGIYIFPFLHHRDIPAMTAAQVRTFELPQTRSHALLK